MFVDTYPFSLERNIDYSNHISIFLFVSSSLAYLNIAKDQRTYSEEDSRLDGTTSLSMNGCVCTSQPHDDDMLPWRNGNALDFYLTRDVAGIQRLRVRAPRGVLPMTKRGSHDAARCAAAWRRCHGRTPFGDMLPGLQEALFNQLF
ncbi:hypothetical protein MJO29_008868 [Puccinia striiformis f. sp. tritici]|nr:hypothetical protein MJO29_008868 [Puccinia striiformis f. sp. tritici]